jgi:phosphoglycerate dehydrogenase-like enzyme
MSRPAFVVVSNERGPGPLTTPAALDTLAAAGEVRDLNIMGLQRDDALRSIESTVADATALVFAPWHTYGFSGLVPDCWALMPSLRVISGTFDNRFEEPGMFGQALGEVNARGIAVIDTSRTMTPQVAEFALLMILSLLRGVPDAIAAVRRGEWPGVEAWGYEEEFVAGDLTGLRVGLAGFGVINRRLAELLQPFRCSLAACDPFLDDETFSSMGVRRADSLSALAAASQIFVVGIPPTPTTQRIIDREVIGALPRGSLFVLVTRMAVVEQEALWERTAAGELRAAVDVYDPEPPPTDAPFRTDPNVLPTPHIAGGTWQAHRRCFQVACEEAVKVAAGERSAFEMTERDAAMYAGRQR